MTQGASRLRIPFAIALAAIALFAAACTGASGTLSPTGSPLETVDDLADASLIPARVSVEPADVADDLVAPSIALPSGEPGSPPAPPTDYQDEPDDFTGFADAYRAVFPGVALTDQQLRAAGGTLCTYLMRHADSNGAVALEEALIEADLNQPGFARSDWLTALEIANEHYCGSFSVDFEGAAP